MQIQPFSDDGGFTCLTNYVLDVVMPSLPPNAWKVLCFVIRKTRGWNKERDRLSYSQIADGTGIDSDATIRAALKLLIDRKFIIASAGSAWKAMSYSLNSTLEIEVQNSTLEIEATTEIEVGSTTEIEGHSTSEIEDTKETNLNKKKEKTPRADRAPSSDHQRLMDLYANALPDRRIPNGKQEGSAAKAILAAGYTPEQAIQVYEYLKRRDFWADQHLSLQTVNKQMGAVIAALKNTNGHVNGKYVRSGAGQHSERKPQTEHDLDKGF